MRSFLQLDSNSFEQDGRALLDMSDCRKAACSEKGIVNIGINAISFANVSRLLVHGVFCGSTGNVSYLKRTGI